MTQETIVAAFDTAAQAQAAARDVEAAGILPSDISHHADAAFGQTTADSMSTLPAGEPARKEPGFWAKLFGTEDQVHNSYGAYTERDHTVYDRTIAGGGSVISIKIADAERDGDRILSILENHQPIDIEERMASYGEESTSAAYAAPLPGSGQVNVTGATTGVIGNTETIQLAEEELQVGKRVVNRGTTRIRRYVVETPVSEDVSLHREDVSVERRPVSASTVVGPDAFTDKTIEVTEMNEEVVVGKTARAVEEVVVRKDVSDRVETVRDTVRREELEIDRIDGKETKSGFVE